MLTLSDHPLNSVHNKNVNQKNEKNPKNLDDHWDPKNPLIQKKPKNADPGDGINPLIQKEVIALQDDMIEDISVGLSQLHDKVCHIVIHN
jgi:hypothetical protein